MGTVDQPPRHVWAFLWGKRRWHRQPTSLRVLVGLEAVTIHAHAVDVSAGGVLLRIPTAELKTLLPEGDTVDLFALQRLFRRWFSVRLGPAGTDRRAQGARIDWRPDEPDALFVGCRLAAPLTARELETLGLEARASDAEAGSTPLPADQMPWQARPETAPFLSTRREGHGAWREGRLLGMHGRNLAFAIEAADPTDLVADLAHHRLEARVLERDVVVARSAAWLLSARMEAGGCIELVVRLEEEPSEALHGLFHVTRGALVG